MKFSSLDSQNALSMTSMPGVFEQVAFIDINSFISSISLGYRVIPMCATSDHLG